MIDLGAVLDLVADGLAHLAHAVGDALLDRERHDVGGEGLEHGRIEVPAGRCDGMAGRDDTRPFDPPEVDGLHEGHVQQQAAGLDEQTEIAHGGEPGPQGAPGVGHGPERAEGRVVLNGVERAAVVGPAEEEVDLHVHQPGEEGHVAEIDLDRVIGHRRRSDLEDAVTADQQVARGHELPAHDVEHAGAAQMGVFRSVGSGHRVLLRLT